MTRRPRVACVGAFIVDTLGRPVTGMPQGQRAQLLEEIVVAPAGSAGGTAIDLAHLGAEVIAVGAVGADAAGAYLRQELLAAGIDPGHLATVAGVQTSASMLAIAADGSRPAWHVVGANGELCLDHMPWPVLTGCDAVHLGGVSALRRLDGAPSAELLRRAREAGALTTVDCLGVKRPDVLELLTPAFPDVDCFFPNDDELAQITGLADPAEGARAIRALGCKTVVVTRGAAGALVVGPDGEFEVPALESEVVDSTGCGDAMVAGTIVGLLRGWSLRRSVELGTAAASLTIAALGSVAGVRSFDQVSERLERGFGKEEVR